MKFWASSETYRTVGVSVESMRKIVEPYLNSAIVKTVLVDFDCKIRYVPIVMPDDMRLKYPSRSTVRKKDKIYDCAPYLDYQIFLSENFELMLREYIGGIFECVPVLVDLGASAEQVSAFENILNVAFDDISMQQINRSRH